MEVILGTKEHDQSEVWIDSNARRKHMAIFGKSGTGKTTLLRNMIVADLHAGNGVTIVDPHGGLIESLLDSIPRHRTDDVIYLPPPILSRVIGLNVMQSLPRNQRSLVVCWTGMLSHCLQRACPRSAASNRISLTFRENTQAANLLDCTGGTILQ